MPWTVAHQFPLSMEFSRQEYWSGLLFSSPGDLPDPGIEPTSLCLLHCRQILYHLSHQGSLESIQNEVQFLSFGPQLKLSSFSFHTRRKVSSLSLHLRKELEVEMSKEELNGSYTVPSLPPRRHFFLVAGATRKQVM